MFIYRMCVSVCVYIQNVCVCVCLHRVCVCLCVCTSKLLTGTVYMCVYICIRGVCVCTVCLHMRVCVFVRMYVLMSQHPAVPAEAHWTAVGGGPASISLIKTPVNVSKA